MFADVASEGKSNAILLPSGDQSLTKPGNVVSWLSCEPSGLAVNSVKSPIAGLNRENVIRPFDPGNAAYADPALVTRYTNSAVKASTKRPIVQIEVALNFILPPLVSWHSKARNVITG